MFLMMPSTKIAQMVPLNRTKGHPKESILQYFGPSLSYLFVLSILEWQFYTGFTVFIMTSALLVDYEITEELWMKSKIIKWAKTWDFNNFVCATSKASDQPAHTHSLIRAFASCLNILWVLSYWPNIIWISKLKRRLHRLVWDFTCQNATLLEITCHGSYISFIWSNRWMKSEIIKDICFIGSARWVIIIVTDVVNISQKL